MISLVVLLITAQLKFTVIYRPISMKERYGAPFLGLAKSIYKVFVRVCNLVVHIYFHSAIRENCGINDCGC